MDRPDFLNNIYLDSDFNFIEEAKLVTPVNITNKVEPQYEEFRKYQKEQQQLLMQQLRNQFRVVNEHFYFKDKADQLAFSDKGERIVSAHNDDRVTQAIVTMAQAKGWQTIKVSGHLDFQRKIWLEASERGIDVHGYKPTEQELEQLERSQLAKQHNAVSSLDNHDKPTIETKSIAQSPQLSQSNNDTYSYKSAKQELNQSEESHPGKQQNIIDKALNQADHNKQNIETKPIAQSPQLSQNNPDEYNIPQTPKKYQETERTYTGQLLAHGAAKYNHQEQNTDSYYIKLATDKGEETIWGADLKRAIAEGKVAINDHITLKSSGSKTVEIDMPVQDETGKIAYYKPREMKRNIWNVAKSDQVKVIEAVAASFIDSHIKDPEQRTVLKEAMEARLIERQKTGTVPTVSTYDKNVASKEPTQEQPTPNIERDLERTR